MLSAISSAQPQTSGQSPGIFTKVAAGFLTCYFIINPTMGAVRNLLNSSRVTVAPLTPADASCAVIPALQITPQEIQAYLQNGTASYFSSDAYLRLQDLDTEDSYENYDEESQLFFEGAQDFLNIAEQQEHPAARAIALHQAKGVVKHSRGIHDRFEAIQKLRIQEADACADAALLDADPQLKLQWVARGLKELKMPLDPHETLAFVGGPKNKCRVASALWLTAAQAFSKLSPQKPSSDYAIVQLPYGSLKEFYTVECLLNAAYCTRAAGDLGASEIAIGDYEKAIEIMKGIDPARLSEESREKLQEKIITATILAYNTADSTTTRALYQDRVYSEAMQAQELYSKASPDIYYSILRALRLEDAAYYAPTTAVSRDRLIEAQHLVQKAWNENRDDCLNIPEFYRHSYGLFAPRFQLEYSLLGRLNAKVERVEKELARETSLLRPIYAVQDWLAGDK